MSWSSRELAMMRLSNNKPYEHVDLEMSEWRNAIDLRWFLGIGDEHLAPEELGAKIDDCLVENISGLLKMLEQGEIGLERFMLDLRFLEEGMMEDSDLQIYATLLQKDKKLPLASKTYRELAERCASQGGTSRVSLEEAGSLAGALLGIVRNSDWDEYDWDIKTYSLFCASLWLHDRNPHEILIYIYQSHWNPAAWDTLDIICADAVMHGLVEMMKLPDSLLHWRVSACYGYPERPGVAPKTPSPPKTHGKKIRDNEIRHAVDLLGQVGVRRMAAYDAVALAVHLGAGSVRNICRDPYCTPEDIRLDIVRRFEPPKQA